MIIRVRAIPQAGAAFNHGTAASDLLGQRVAARLAGPSLAGPAVAGRPSSSLLLVSAVGPLAGH
jgi:hypothetical protein